MQLSEHFTLEELCHSQEASRRGIANDPNPATIEHMRQLCLHVLEPLRAQFGPFVPSSCFRSPTLNAAIGGAKTSQHMEGKAADIIIPGHSLAEVYNWITANLPFDQVIREFPPGGWVHVSYDAAQQRGTRLLAVLEAGKAVYHPQAGPVAV